MAALRQVRSRLLRLEHVVDDSAPGACDVISDESLYSVAADLPRLPAGTVLFRAAMLEEGCCCPPGGWGELGRSGARPCRAAQHWVSQD
jgi:hypothetical protein